METTPTEGTGMQAEQTVRHRRWQRFTDILFMVIAVLFIRTFVVQAYQIPSGSMENTLLVGDYLIANKFIYGPHIPFTEWKIRGFEPSRGDVIIFRSPTEDRDYIKRCIGLPGEMVEIRDNRVFIDGDYLEEDYANLDGMMPPQANFGPIEVSEGHLFMLGDNRNYSKDSRFWGTLDMNLIRGKAELIHWSWNADEKRPRLSRLGDRVK